MLNLPPEESGYIQYRETEEHFIIDIGHSEEIDTIYNESFARMKVLEDKFNQKLLDILNSLEAAEKKTTPSKCTPAKAFRNKRPPPKSSSVNKLRRSKRRLDIEKAGSSSKVSKTALDGNSTPAKLLTTGNVRRELSPSPYTLRRLEAEREKEIKLIASEDKRKKADEKKQILLKTRAQLLKEERELRMEKIRKNKLALEEQAKEAAEAKGSNELGSPTGPRRCQFRRKVLDKIVNTETTGPQTRAARARAAAEASTTQTTGNNENGTNSTRPKGTVKKGLAKKVSKKLAASKEKPSGKVQSKATNVKPVPTLNEIANLSPIVSENRPKKGINTRLSETFTFEANTSAKNVTFAVPQAVPLTKAAAAAADSPHCNAFHSTKGLLTPTAAIKSAVSQYHITPPPPNSPFLDENYDISKYIDSDDEEAQEEAQVKSGQKRMPSWAGVKVNLLKLLKRQFSRPPETLVAQAAQIFPAPLMPVPLDEMGLPVKEKYVTRSSSVDWKTIAQINKQLESNK
ncbi:hypothetical protein TYRP_008217 [Tyrophagus putrescentiae]|nr:hypothetical protein TYRP_008217 [Tyrophagus putrescentiae]